MLTWTLQSLIDENMELRAYCDALACCHSADLDLLRLRDRLGPDSPAMRADLLPRLSCARCGGRKVGLIYSPASNRQRIVGQGHNRSTLPRSDG